MTVVEALGPTVAVLKPQSAFFESYGSAGIAVLEKVLAAAREAGALVLLDAKRGDIGSTMAAYAAAYLTDEVAAGRRRADRVALPGVRVAAAGASTSRWPRDAGCSCSR